MTGRFALLALVALRPASLAADEGPVGPALVVDTDMALDDALTLALLLQSPSLELVAVVASPGAQGGAAATRSAGQLLARFNRSDVALYAPAVAADPGRPPAYRPQIERTVAAALAGEVPIAAQPFTPEAYTAAHPLWVVVLGPLTNLARALAADPALARRLTRVIVVAEPPPDHCFNIDVDPAALADVRRAGVPLEWLSPKGAGAAKPAGWAAAPAGAGRPTSLGAAFVDRLLADAEVRAHYLARPFHDELLPAWLVRPAAFASTPAKVHTPADLAAISGALQQLLAAGRQAGPTTVLVSPLPDAALQPELRARRAAIVARHGETEWRAQLVLNELHQHLGAYSIIGVKMGLRAAELLNAPAHGMAVLSRVAPRPPVSCLEDGLMVATGSTVGRGLFARGEPRPEVVSAEFSYNGRRLTLTLAPEYTARVRERIAALLARHTLEDAAYWDGVRALGLEIWEQWHRLDLFRVTEPTR